MTKVALGLLVAVLVAVFAARFLYHVTSGTDNEPTLQPWTQNRMEFVAWNDERWTAWIRGDRFELLPREEGRWRQHVNVTLAFINWQGDPWQAKIDGEEFLLAYRGNWQGRIQRATAIRYRDWTGHHQVRTVAQLSH